MIERAQLRKELKGEFSTRSDLEAFTCDYFPNLYQKFAGQPFEDQLSEVLARAEPDEILKNLQNYKQNRPTQTNSLLLNTQPIIIEPQPTGQVRWYGVPPEELIRYCWGTPAGAPGRSADFQCHWRYPQQQALSMALLRLAIHSGDRQFAAEDAPLWLSMCIEELRDCIGVDDDNWRPREPMKRDSQRWHISEIDCSNNDKVVIMKKSLKSGDEVDGKHFADYLNASMDQWIIDRIDAKLDNVICGRSIEILTYRLHQDYITSIGNVWPKWRALLSGSPEIRRHVLSCSLATADSASPDGGPGLLRAGPRTVTRCLLQAFVFAMVIEAALSPLGSDTSPKQAEPPANFELLGDNAQLFGLLLVNKQALGQALLKMAWRTRYVLLPNERFSMKDLRHYRRIGIAADRQAQLSQKVENEMLITQDNFIFSWLLERPATELQDYLREVFAELDQRVRAGSKAASESTMKKWAQA